VYIVYIGQPDSQVGVVKQENQMTMQQQIASLPEFIGDKRMIASNGLPTNAGYREISTRAFVARGATREHAEWLASLSFFTTKKGSVAFRKSDGTASHMSAADCALIGREPGKGNY
jgi:hypothetical protein